MTNKSYEGSRMIYFLILLFVISSEARGVRPIAKVYDTKGFSDVPSENNETCRTKTCYRVANSFLDTMDESIDPCNNFYNFACGNWKIHGLYPEYASLNAEIEKMTMLARDRLRYELSKAPSPDEILPVQQMKKLYKSCMRMTQADGVASINAILNRHKGWPMVMEADTWDTINARKPIKWQEIDSYYEQLMGLNAFYKVEMENSPNEYGVLLITKEENPLDDLSFVRWFAEELMIYNGIEIDNMKLDREIEELRIFAEEINKVPTTGFTSFNSADIASLLEWWNNDVAPNEHENSIDWRNFFDRLLNIVNIPKIWDTPILLENEEYFKQLSKVLESTDTRIIVNFIHSHFILRRRPMFHEGNTVLCGGTGNPRWLDCLHEREPAVAHLFITKYYQNYTEGAVDQMILNFVDAFEHQIKNSNWLSDEKKDNAIDIVKELDYIMGYEKWYADKATLIDYYKHVTIGDNYPENIYRLKKHEWVKNIQYWGRPTKNAKWDHSVVEVNGETIYMFKSVIVPAATLQSPLIAPTIPYYVTYGELGNVIGHEIGHWFDSNEGSFFGTLTDPVYKPIFNELAQCFIDLINSYVDGSGNLTLAENLADWYGMQAVFHAYKELREKEHPDGEQKLPGLEKYNDQQMFFLSFSQFWCGADSYNWNHDDPHQAGAIRVLATLSQTTAFAEAFQCPENSRMNPEKKCNMWMKEPDTP